jgi:hypothetical protein
MRTMFIPLVLVLSLSASGLAHGQNNQGQNNNNQGQNNNNQGGYRGAPGPLVGAGLPVLLIAGGVYWIVRRRKSSSGD